MTEYTLIGAIEQDESVNENAETTSQLPRAGWGVFRLVGIHRLTGDKFIYLFEDESEGSVGIYIDYSYQAAQNRSKKILITLFGSVKPMTDEQLVAAAQGKSIEIFVVYKRKCSNKECRKVLMEGDESEECPACGERMYVNAFEKGLAAPGEHTSARPNTTADPGRGGRPQAAGGFGQKPSGQQSSGGFGQQQGRQPARPAGGFNRQQRPEAAAAKETGNNVPF